MLLFEVEDEEGEASVAVMVPRCFVVKFRVLREGERRKRTAAVARVACPHRGDSCCQLRVDIQKLAVDGLRTLSAWSPSTH